MSLLFTNCFVALGTSTANGALVELTGGSYARLAVNLTGSIAAGMAQTIGPFAAAATAPGASSSPSVVSIRSAAIFDAVTGGNQLCYWNWIPPRSYTAITAAFPATVMNLALLPTLAASFAVFSNAIDPGSQIGTLNGDPLIAGTASISIVNGNFTAMSQVVSETNAWLVGTPSFANDAAAAAGGVPVGGTYRNGSVPQLRVS